MSRFPSLRDHATVIDVFGLDTALTRPADCRGVMAVAAVLIFIASYPKINKYR